MMPDRKRVESLVQHTVEGRLIEALETFYHEDVMMQENNLPPRIGLAASIERQKMAKAAAMEIHEIKAASVLIDGDRAAIEWHAEPCRHGRATASFTSGFSTTCHRSSAQASNRNDAVTFHTLNIIGAFTPNRLGDPHRPQP
jgi:hypothetical protein